MATRARASILVVRRQRGDPLLDQPRVLRSRGLHGARGRHRAGGAAAGRRARPTWSCSTSTCRTSTASRSAGGCGPRRATARMPVIHLSATFVDDVDKVHGLDAGADGYLTHPVEPPVLVATVNAFLRARRAEDALRESEAKFKAVFEQALNGIALLSRGPDLPRRQSGDVRDARARRATTSSAGTSRPFNAGGRNIERRGDHRGAGSRPGRGAARCRCCTRTAARRARLERLACIGAGHPPRHRHRHHRAPRRSRPSGSGSWPARRGARRGRARQPAQGRLPGGALARAAHAAQRHRRLVAAAQAARRRRRRRPGHGVERHRAQRPRPGPADRRPARRVAHHLGQAAARSAVVRPGARRSTAAVENVQPAALARDIADRRRPSRAIASRCCGTRRASSRWSGTWSTTPSSSRRRRPRHGPALQTESASELAVTDQGRGISPDFLPHVFEPFRQERRRHHALARRPRARARDRPSPRRSARRPHHGGEPRRSARLDVHGAAAAAGAAPRSHAAGAAAGPAGPPPRRRPRPRGRGRLRRARS